VTRNQRERLFGAMVASVAERGYEATRVADLVDLSGISSRSFYNLFPDKRACFLAAMEAVIEMAVNFAASSVTEPGSWEERARSGFDVFAAMIVAQPAAARMCLVDSYVAGPEVLEPLERAVGGFEWLTRETLGQSPERAGMPSEMITAHIGAMQEIARTRLRRGTHGKLPALMDQLWDFMLTFRPPPAPLRQTGRSPSPQPERLDGHDQAERVLRAFAAVVAEQGYANATIDQVVKRASISATTFYAHFEGKEDALMAAIDSGMAQMVAATVPAYRRAANWPEGIRAAFGAMFSYLASSPAFARLLAVEVYAAGPAAVERRSQAVKPLEALGTGVMESSPETPRIALEAIAGGVYALAYRQVRDKGPEFLPALAPLCTYITLVPFIGAEEACRVANGDGRGGRRSQARGS
jgi:AcrR family transcriptional regulator